MVLTIYAESITPPNQPIDENSVLNKDNNLQPEIVSQKIETNKQNISQDNEEDTKQPKEADSEFIQSLMRVKNFNQCGQAQISAETVDLLKMVTKIFTSQFKNKNDEDVFLVVESKNIPNNVNNILISSKTKELFRVEGENGPNTTDVERYFFMIINHFLNLFESTLNIDTKDILLNVKSINSSNAFLFKTDIFDSQKNNLSHLQLIEKLENSPIDERIELLEQITKKKNTLDVLNVFFSPANKVCPDLSQITLESGSDYLEIWENKELLKSFKTNYLNELFEEFFDKTKNPVDIYIGLDSISVDQKTLIETYLPYSLFSSNIKQIFPMQDILNLGGIDVKETYKKRDIKFLNYPKYFNIIDTYEVFPFLRIGSNLKAIESLFFTEIYKQFIDKFYSVQEQLSLFCKDLKIYVITPNQKVLVDTVLLKRIQTSLYQVLSNMISQQWLDFCLYIFARKSYLFNYNEAVKVKNKMINFKKKQEEKLKKMGTSKVKQKGEMYKTTDAIQESQDKSLNDLINNKNGFIPFKKILSNWKNALNITSDDTKVIFFDQEYVTKDFIDNLNENVINKVIEALSSNKYGIVCSRSNLSFWIISFLISTPYVNKVLTEDLENDQNFWALESQIVTRDSSTHDASGAVRHKKFALLNESKEQTPYLNRLCNLWLNGALDSYDVDEEDVVQIDFDRTSEIKERFPETKNDSMISFVILKKIRISKKYIESYRGIEMAIRTFFKSFLQNIKILKLINKEEKTEGESTVVNKEYIDDVELTKKVQFLIEEFLLKELFMYIY